jgi:hypothetical protein
VIFFQISSYLPVYTLLSKFWISTPGIPSYNTNQFVVKSTFNGVWVSYQWMGNRDFTGERTLTTQKTRFETTATTATTATAATTTTVSNSSSSNDSNSSNHEQRRRH